MFHIFVSCLQHTYIRIVKNPLFFHKRLLTLKKFYNSKAEAGSPCFVMLSKTTQGRSQAEKLLSQVKRINCQPVIALGKENYIKEKNTDVRKYDSNIDFFYITVVMVLSLSLIHI